MGFLRKIERKSRRDIVDAIRCDIHGGKNYKGKAAGMVRSFMQNGGGLAN